MLSNFENLPIFLKYVNWDTDLASGGMNAKVNRKSQFFFAWTAETRSTIEVLFILCFVSDPESESEQPHHDSAPLESNKYGGLLGYQLGLSQSFQIISGAGEDLATHYMTSASEPGGGEGFAPWNGSGTTKTGTLPEDRRAPYVLNSAWLVWREPLTHGRRFKRRLEA